MKTHLRDRETIENLPEEEILKRAKEKTGLAVCGYVRRVTDCTYHVTCEQCKKKKGLV